MARTRPKKKKSTPPAASGDNNTMLLAFAGFTALAIGILVVIAIVSTQDGPAPDQQGLVPEGEQFPELSAETVDGGNVTVGGNNGEPAMVAFFWTDCPACNEEAPYISDLAQQYEDLQVVMVGVDGRDNAEAVSQFVDEYGIEGQAVYDQALAGDYGVTAYPTNYFVDANGRVVAAHQGLAPQEDLEGWAEEAIGS